MAIWKRVIFLFSYVSAIVQARGLQKGVHYLLSGDEIEQVFETSHKEVPEYDVVHPVLLDDQGEFMSDDVAYDDQTQASKNLHFGLSAFGRRYHMDMKLNTDQLLAPHFVTEIRNNGKPRYERSVDLCHYLGYVVTDKGLGDKVALSNCDGGLTGVIQGKKEVLMIKPIPKRLGLNKPTHVAYKRYHDDAANIVRQFGMDVRSILFSKKNQAPFPLPVKQENDAYSTQYYIEALVVTDKNMLTYHGTTKRLKNYVLTLMNIVHSLIGDPSVGAKIKYVLNKLEILKTYEPGFYVNSHASNSLSRFCKWTTKQKNGLKDSDNAYFDNAVLISRTPFCAKTDDPHKEDCKSLLGLADLGGMCGHESSCVLSTDNGLGTSFTIAHETGHNLNAKHDGESNHCRDAVNIMARKASGKPTGYQWSSCSRDYIVNFLRGSRSHCLKDAPGQSVEIPTSIPGQEYTLDDQCKLMVKGSTGFCNQPGNLDISCSALWCLTGNICQTINEPAAEGSKCGVDKYCKRGVCLHKSAFGKNGPKPVNGGFSAWSIWGSCSHTCGGGVMVRTRQCSNPKPKNFGLPCMGEYKDFKYCVTQKCPSPVKDPRMKACEGKRNVPFAGNKLYDWVYNPMGQVAAKDRCKLTCEAPLGSQGQYTFFTFGNVENGLRCDGKGSKGVCINGFCKKLGCDNIIGSKAALDQCGVCNGDSSSCSTKHIKGAYNKVPDYSYNADDYQTITTIPAGMKGIMVVENTTSKNFLALETASKKAILNMNHEITSGNANITSAGTTFVYTQHGYKEKIIAEGPLTEAVVVKFLLDYSDYEANGQKSNYHVAYRYIETTQLPANDVSKGKANQYIWKTTAQGCSATCGGGKRLITVQCVRAEDSSPVTHDKCESSEEPKGLSEDCNTQVCPPRWSVKEWLDCSKTCNDGTLGQQSREVMCVFTSNGEEEVLDDSDCKEPKPKTVQSCGYDECPAEWATVKASACSSKCGKGIRHFTVICQKIDTQGRKKNVSRTECPGDDKPPSTLSCHTPC